MQVWLVSRLEVASHGIFEAWTTFQIAVEGIGDVENTLDVFHTKRLFLVNGESLSCADGILDLFKVSKYLTYI